MDVPKLSAAELELLNKVLPKGVVDKILHPKKERNAPPPLIKMEEFSGKIITTCLCCGVSTVHYVDYIKRKDCEGYAMRTVKNPSHAVKREHISDVIICEFCHDINLFKFDKSDLITMIINLRKQLRKGEKK
jgi:hypothetical protein